MSVVFDVLGYNQIQTGLYSNTTPVQIEPKYSCVVVSWGFKRIILPQASTSTILYQFCIAARHLVHKRTAHSRIIRQPICIQMNKLDWYLRYIFAYGFYISFYYFISFYRSFVHCINFFFVLDSTVKSWMKRLFSQTTFNCE